MKKLKNKLIFIVILFSINLISAAGLTVIGNSSFQINKSVGVPEIIIFELRNDFSQTMYNITFEDNDFIEMDLVDLAVGESKNITATIKGNQDINQNIRIEGLYESSLGPSSETYVIEIDYATGITPCEISIIKGDTIVWNNFVSDEIKLINYGTGLEMTTILENGNYSSTFNTPEVLNYYATRRGFKFSDYCQVVALSDTGLIHNPSYDAFINLIISADYDPTTLSVIYTEDIYSLDVGSTAEGVFTIKNTGTNIAKNIHLSGKWFTFNTNDFDLAVGQTKGIIYYILPYITTTNETNKNYTTNITVEGNFDNYLHNFKIFINYADIDSGSYGAGKSIIDVIIEYCENNPDAAICNSGKVVVYNNTNASQDFNVTFNVEQVRKLFEYLFNLGDNQKILDEYMKDKFYQVGLNISQIVSSQTNMSEDMNKLQEEKSKVSTAIIVMVVVIMVLITVSGLMYMILYYRKQRKIDRIKKGYAIKK